MQLLAWFLPAEAAVLVVVAIGFAIMLGFKKAARGLLGLLLVLILSPLFMPLIDTVVDSLPWWLLVVVIAWFGVWMLRTLLSTVLGRDAANTAVGHLASEGILGALRLMVLPFRLLFRRAR